MISINSIIFLILIRVITNVHSQSSTGDVSVLGVSACETYNILQAACKLPDAPIQSYPDGCSSYLFSGIDIVNNTITDSKAEHYNITGNLDQLLKTNKNVIAYYSHGDIKDWCDAIDPNNAAGQTSEINNLKTFLEEHKGIKGIVLSDLNVQVDPMVGCPNFNQNLKCFIGLMKKSLPDLSIGINIYARHQMLFYQYPELPWMDFHVLDPVADFYMVGISYINDCSDVFFKTGPYPLTGDYNATVDSIRTLIEEAGAKSSKIHYKFSNGAESTDVNADFCTLFMANYCKNPNEAKKMCADTLQTFYDKGKYAKDHGAGFVVNCIDTDDFDCTCQCGQSYPSFNALLNGFNGGPPPPPCALLDRT